MGSNALGETHEYVYNQWKRRNASDISVFIAAYYDRTHIDPQEVELVEETTEGPTLRKKYYFRRRGEGATQEEYKRLWAQYLAANQMAHGELVNFLANNDPAYSTLYAKILELRCKCADYAFLESRVKFLDARLTNETEWANDYFHKWEKATRKIETLEAQILTQDSDCGALECEWCGFKVDYTETTLPHAMNQIREHSLACEKNPNVLRIRKLEEALAFYADPKSYRADPEDIFSTTVDRDNGRVARKALAKPQEHV